MGTGGKSTLHKLDDQGFCDQPKALRCFERSRTEPGGMPSKCHTPLPVPRTAPGPNQTPKGTSAE